MRQWWRSEQSQQTQQHEQHLRQHVIVTDAGLGQDCDPSDEMIVEKCTPASEGSSHRQIATVTSYPINQNTRVKLILQHVIVIIRWTQAKTWGTEILEEEVEAESRKRIPKIQCLDNERDLFAMVVNILNFNWHCKSRAWELCYLCNSFDCSCSRSGEKDMNSMYGRIFNSA